MRSFHLGFLINGAANQNHVDCNNEADGQRHIAHPIHGIPERNVQETTAGTDECRIDESVSAGHEEHHTEEETDRIQKAKADGSVPAKNGMAIDQSAMKDEEIPFN